jgi:hypothetical protein
MTYIKRFQVLKENQWEIYIMKNVNVIQWLNSFNREDLCYVRKTKKSNYKELLVKNKQHDVFR